MSPVVIEATSTVNPLAEGWRRAFEAVGLPAVGVMVGSEAGDSLPPHWMTVQAFVEQGLRPACIVSWWGLAALSHSRLHAVYPSARRTLIVDTYPNASRASTEFRESVSHLLKRNKVDLVVTYSREMTNSLRTRHLFPRDMDFIDLVQPFPISAHRDREESLSQSVIFTGRSDYLYTRERSMLKDALGSLLEQIRESGFNVTVQKPQNQKLIDQLIDRGYRLYEPLSNSQVLRGDLADMIAAHSLHFAGYRVANPTIRRRISAGLSSRFSMGLTSVCPMIVPVEAQSASEFLQRQGIGCHVQSMKDVAQAYSVRDQFRSAWRQHHVGWSAEGTSDALHYIAGV